MYEIKQCDNKEPLHEAKQKPDKRQAFIQEERQIMNFNEVQQTVCRLRQY